MSPHDDERLPGEDELAALYRKLPDKQPGPALHAAVLRAAAEAIRPAAARPRRPRWPVALGTAATLALAFGLTWHMREWPSATQPAPMPTVPAERSESAPPEAAVATAPAPAPVPAPTPPPKSAVPAILADAVPRPASRELARRSEIHKSAPSGILANRQRVMSAPPAAPAPIAEMTVAAAPAAEPNASQGGFDAARSDQPLAGAASKPTAQAFAAPAPAPFVNQSAPAAKRAQLNRIESMSAAVPQQAAQEQATASAQAYAQAPASTPAYAPAPIAPPPADLAANSSQSDPTAAQAGDTPAQELEKIRQLFALYRRDEARQRLAAFHRTHPDYVLPPELRSQLPTP